MDLVLFAANFDARHAPFAAPSDFDRPIHFDFTVLDHHLDLAPGSRHDDRF